MKLLFVTSEAQMTGTGGGVTHTRGVIGVLNRIPGATLKELVLPLPFASAPHRLRQLRALARSAFSPWPSKAHYLLSSEALNRFREAVKDRPFDAVVLNGADLLPLAEILPHSGKCILVTHNVESDIIGGQVASLRLPAAVKGMLSREVEKARRHEVSGSRSVSAIIAISEDDARWYRRNAPGTPVLTLSGAFDYPPYSGPKPSTAEPLKLGYLAKMSWWPNREGAEWFLSSVLPELDRDRVEVHFFGPGSEAFAGSDPALHAHGFVDSLESVWRETGIAICPILSGSGLNIKLIEALYNGIPVLATPRACEGLPPLKEPGLAIVPPEDWVTFLRSPEAAALASISVKKETSDAFAADAHARRIAEALTKVLRAPAKTGCGDTLR